MRLYSPVFGPVLGLSLVLAGCGENRASLPWQNSRLPVEKRVEDRLRRMTAAEKLDLIERHPLIRAADVPPGFAPGIAMAATWNTDLAAAEARAIAHEALIRGWDQLLAPDVQSYGEDPFLASRMTVAYVGAMQVEGIVATPLHFPANRNQDERAAREIRLPPFRAAVEEAGVWSILASGDDPSLLDDVLKKEWGFKGFLLGDRSPDAVDDKARRVLGAMFATGYFDRQRGGTVVDNTNERNLVRRAVAEQSAILLKNTNGLLPVDTSRIHTIAVIGANGLEGIRERAGTLIQVRFAEGDDLAAAADLARKSDLAIVAVAGQTPERLIQRIAGVNPKTVVVLTHGPVANASRWIGRVPAVVSAWLPGGIAAVLFGDATPSGKLPITYARADAPGGETGIYVGYRYFDKNNLEPLFPFGYGLSYTEFAYSDLKIFPATPRYGQIVQVTLNVRNTGTRPGAEVVQVYVHQVKSSVDRPLKELKAFKRVELKPGETQSVSIVLDRRSMWFFDPTVRDWATEPGVYDVMVGASSRDIRVKGSFELFQ